MGLWYQGIPYLKFYQKKEITQSTNPSYLHYSISFLFGQTDGHLPMDNTS